MLPACMLFRLPLRFRLALRLTEPFFLRVPLREGVEPWFSVVEALEAREAERWGMSPSRTEEPRVRASKFSSNLPLRSSGALEP
jgi:hypothetical protein